MVETLKIYTYIDGINDTPFPNLENQIKISEYTYTSQRMGSVSLSATIMYKDCLDNVWSGNEYVTFQGEKYFIKDTPTSSKTNDDERYKHELEFVGERAILDMVYFYDVIIDANDENRYQSNSTKVIFSGDIAQFVQRFNYTLQYSNIGYNVVIDNGISSDNKTVSFEDKYISEALQEIFNIYELPYYFVGKTIHVGYTNNAITQIFKYGIDESLLSITKTNANYAITNRCTGIGSTENIPYYYPNDTDNREEIESSGGTWITPSQNLMPPKYRDTNGLERFYNALNNTYISPQTGEYYHFDNVYNGSNPKEIKVSFDDIKPTIKGTLNAIGDRIDQIADIAFDDKDNDDLKPESETEYQHPYFFVKLRKTDGTYGFNLFDKAIVGTDMSLSMTDGNCSACNFTISVDSETMKNPVQVDEKGNLKRDKDGNVIIVGTAQDKQNDTEHNEVWLALKKDISTFGVIMPNASFGYKPSIGDTFVVLGIILPKSYILNAENKLKEEIIKYMATNNNEKFTFSINFSRIYLEENPIIANQINENARVQIEYNNQLYDLYISNYAYKASKDAILPEITVELEDTIAVSQSSLKTKIDAVKQDIMSSIGSMDFLKMGLKYFLRKDMDDTTNYSITAKDIIVNQLAKIYNLDVDNVATILSLIVTNKIGSKVYSHGFDGQGFILNNDTLNHWTLEVDDLMVRNTFTIFELIVSKIRSINGGLMVSSANGKIKEVEILLNPARANCKIKVEGDNGFVEDDYIKCQTFSQNVQKSYLYKVEYIWNDYIYIALKDGVALPSVGDEIVQFGNATNVARQGAIYITASEHGKPTIDILDGIDNGIISGHIKTRVGYLGDITGDANFGSLSGYGIFSDNCYLKGNFVLMSTNKPIEDSLQELANQIDGKMETFFGDDVPTLNNYPANEWLTESDRQSHLGDLYYQSDRTGYRFQMSDNVYLWVVLTDSVATQALAEAQAANAKLAEWAKDSVISPTEKIGLQNEITKIDSDYNYLSGVNNRGYSDNINALFTLYRNAYNSYKADLVYYSNTNVENIPLVDTHPIATDQSAYYGTKVTYTSAVDSYERTSLSDNLKAINDRADDIDSQLATWASDSYISPTEKLGLKDEISRIANDKDKVNSSYNLLTDKTTLTPFYNAYIAAYNTYNSDLIYYTKSEPQDIQIDTTNHNISVNQKTYYNAQFAFFSKLELYNKNLIDNQFGDLDDRIIAITDNLDIWASDGYISPTEKLGLKNEITKIEADYNNELNIFNNFGEMPLATLDLHKSYRLAYAAYKRDLVYYTASTPENIAIVIGYPLSSDSAAYYAALNTVLKAYQDDNNDKITVKISTLDGKITQEVTDRENGDQSVIVQTSENIKLAISKLDVGGTNYALGTENPLNFHVFDGDNQVYKLYDVNKGVTNSDIVVSFDIIFDYASDWATDTEISIQFGVAWGWSPINITDQIKGDYTHIVAMSHLDSYNVDDAIYLRFNWFNDDGVEIKNLKVERGNKATDWSPAPKDLPNSLLATGINISNGEIDLTADKVSVYDNSGNKMALFETNGDNKGKLSTNLINTDELVAKQIATADSGKRVLIQDNKLSMYDANNNLKLTVSGDALSEGGVDGNTSSISWSYDKVGGSATSFIYKDLCNDFSLTSANNIVTIPSIRISTYNALTSADYYIPMRIKVAIYIDRQTYFEDYFYDTFETTIPSSKLSLSSGVHSITAELTFLGSDISNIVGSVGIVPLGNISWVYTNNTSEIASNGVKMISESDKYFLTSTTKTEMRFGNYCIILNANGIFKSTDGGGTITPL